MTTPDPEADYWTTADIAAYWGVKEKTVQTYLARRGEKEEVPVPDTYFGRKAAWKPETIRTFQRKRPDWTVRGRKA